MQNTSESLSLELEELETFFSTVSEKLAKASEQFQQSRIPLSQELVASLSDYERRFADLARRILEHGKDLSLSADQLATLSAATLDELKCSLQMIVEIEEQMEDERKKAATKASAVASLERALRIARRNQTDFAPLVKLHTNARAIRDEIVASSASELPQAAEDLAESKHVISLLLDLIEHQEKLTDDECLSYHEIIAASLGKDLAVAALRGKLEVQSAAVPSASAAHDESPVESTKDGAAPGIEGAPTQSNSERASDASNASFRRAKSDLDAEIEKFLEGAAQEVVGRKDPSREEPRNSRGNAAGVSDINAVSGSKTQSDPLSAESSTEQPSALLLAAFEVGDSVLETVKLEEQADHCMAEGKHSEAEAHYQQLLTLQTKIFGTKDPKVATTLQNLATVRRLQERPRALADNEGQWLFPDENPEKTSGTGKRTSLRIGVIAVLVVLGVSVYAAIRYRHADAKAPAVHSSASLPEANQPLPVTPPPPDRVPAEPQVAETIAPPKSVAKQEVAVKPAPRDALVATNSGLQQKAPQLEPVVNPKIVRGPDPLPPVLPNGMNGGSSVAAGNVLSGLISSAPALPPPPPAPAPVAPPLQRIRVGGLVAAAKLLAKTTPVYPAVARNNHIQGTVRLEAVIAKDGSIGKLAAISGPPLLTNAAISAVKQWRYQPTLLNGAPVEVETTVDVNFTLNQ